MPPRLPRINFRPTRALKFRCVSQSNSFASTARPCADNPSSIADILNPSKSTTATSTPVLPRGPGETADDSNPALFPSADQLPGLNPSPSPDARPLPNITRVATSTQQEGQGNDSSHSRIKRILQRGGTARESEARRLQEAATKRQVRQRRTALENQATRLWRDGDVYAPHDLSPAEMVKNRNARVINTQYPPPLNSRRHGWRDVVDDLGIDPVKEYKNFAMMSEFMLETGRIRHGRQTGLRAVNQRKMAKAVRRAVGLGLMPSVHRHPELFEERLAQRGQLGVLAARPGWAKQ